MDADKNPTLRYTPPTRYDTAPLGTVSKVMQENGTHKLFIQLNKEPDTARWEPIAYLLEEVLSEYITRPLFIEAFLNAYFTKDKESVLKISDILRT